MSVIESNGKKNLMFVSQSWKAARFGGVRRLFAAVLLPPEALRSLSSATVDGIQQCAFSHGDPF